MYMNDYNKKHREIPVNKGVRILHDPEKEIIPRVIYQTWKTLNLPTKMRENVNLLKIHNPRFVHYLFDDEMCKQFIGEHFGEEVLYTFNKLKPGAYRADLWRYCVLYINGGIYLDIKYRCVNGFTFQELLDKEYFVKDRIYNGEDCGLYNGLMVCAPRNPALYSCIQDIVRNVQAAYYVKYNNKTFISAGLMITGPILLGQHVILEQPPILRFSKCAQYIQRNGYNILQIYREYIAEKNTDTPYYATAYANADIYNFRHLSPEKVIHMQRKITRNIQNELLWFVSLQSSIVHNPENSAQYILETQWVSTKYTSKNKQYLHSFTILNKQFNRINDDIFVEDGNLISLTNLRLFISPENTLCYIAKEDNIDYSGECVLSYTGIQNKYILTKTNRRESNNFSTPSYILYNNVQCMITNWNPIRIKSLSRENEVNKEINTPNAPIFEIPISELLTNNLYSCCAGVLWKNEIWFVFSVHQSNHYQHFFGVFDTNMILLRYSELVKLSQSREELCSGLIIEEDKMIITFRDTYSSFISIYSHKTIDLCKWYTSNNETTSLENVD